MTRMAKIKLLPIRQLIAAERNHPAITRIFNHLRLCYAIYRMYLFVHRLQTQPSLDCLLEYEIGIANTFFVDWLSRRPDFAQLICEQCHAITIGPSFFEAQQNDCFCQQLTAWKDSLGALLFSLCGYQQLFSQTNDDLWKHRSKVVVPAGFLGQAFCDYNCQIGFY